MGEARANYGVAGNAVKAPAPRRARERDAGLALGRPRRLTVGGARRYIGRVRAPFRGPTAETPSMPSQKLVRCHIRRPAPEGADTERFVPLEIFGLWEYLMRTKHEFEIVKPLASLWLDMEDSPEAAYTESQFDRVTEVTAFVYSGRDEMFMRACRYFPTHECAKLQGR